MSDKKTEDMKFEEALAELEKIVASLENQTAPLDESITLYENGIALVKQCSKLLDDAQQKVGILSRNESGEVVVKPFSTESNE
ncbi:MAG: exodeoxyribonuclease VII small subunit [Clostridia bacterium]|nr:exodeoxyribonuclease VII small subunit [Clostridia bacterium]